MFLQAKRGRRTAVSIGSRRVAGQDVVKGLLRMLINEFIP